MKPGMTMVPEQSIFSPPASRLGPTATIFFPSISTSAFSKSPTPGSRVRTTPPFSTLRFGSRFLTVSLAVTPAANVAAAAGAPDATATAASPEAPVSRNSRRELPPRAGPSMLAVDGSGMSSALLRLRMKSSSQGIPAGQALPGKARPKCVLPYLSTPGQQQPDKPSSDEGERGIVPFDSGFSNNVQARKE